MIKICIANDNMCSRLVVGKPYIVESGSYSHRLKLHFLTLIDDDGTKFVSLADNFMDSEEAMIRQHIATKAVAEQWLN